MEKTTIYVVVHRTIDPALTEEFELATLFEEKAIQYVADKLWLDCDKRELFDPLSAPQSFIDEITELLHTSESDSVEVDDFVTDKIYDTTPSVTGTYIIHRITE